MTIAERMYNEEWNNDQGLQSVLDMTTVAFSPEDYGGTEDSLIERYEEDNKFIFIYDDNSRLELTPFIFPAGCIFINS